MVVSRVVLAVFAVILSLACAQPQITVTPSSLSTTDPTQITIVGASLIGVTGVTIDGINCPIDTNDTVSVVCTIPPGIGSGRPLIVTGTTPTLTTTVDYDVAADVELCGGPTGNVMINTTTQAVNICGENFGDSSIVAQAGWTGRFGVYVGNFLATIVSHDDGLIVFQPPIGAAGKLLPVKVYFGTNVVHIDGVTFSYPAPVVTGIKTITGLKRATHAERVAIYGKHFGAPSASLHDTATVGGFACGSLVVISDTEIHCSVTGYGANHEVVVTSNGQTSPSSATSTGGAAVRYDFANPITPGLACVPPNGAVDILNRDVCNCFSGYASTDPVLAIECNVRAVCPGRTTTLATVAEFPPSRPHTEFKDDHLFIKQTMPIVKNRRDTVIQFVIPALVGYMDPIATPGTTGESTCFYPGNIWQKKVNDLDCLDEFYGVLPWTQNVLCGFVEDTHQDEYHRNYRSSLVTSYTEIFKKSDGTLMFRKISNAFLVSVSFVRHVTALTSTSLSVIIADENAEVSLSVSVNGDALYDVSSKDTLIAFETSIVWPYQIDSVTLNGTWTPASGTQSIISALAVLSEVQSGDMMCDMSSGSDCTQSWLLTIKVGTVCNLQGVLSFPTQNLLCRDLNRTAVPCPSQPSTSFSIAIGKTDLCDGSDQLDATAGMTHVIEPYFDSAFTQPQNVFQTGDMIYFKITITDPLSTIDSIAFHDVTTMSSADHTVHDTLMSVVPVTPPVVAFSVSAFNFTELTDSVAPGAPAVLTFHFRLNRGGLNVVMGLSSAVEDMTKQITVAASVDIYYHGNQKKRSIVATSGLPIPSVSHSQISFYDADNELIENENKNKNEENVDELPVEEDIISFFNLSSASSYTTASFVVVAVVGVAALILA